MGKQPWCVKWNSAKGWCATWRNMKPSDDAWEDRTACGYVVILRTGSGRRQPTCPDCKKAVARRRKP